MPSDRLEMFIADSNGRYPVRRNEGSSVMLSRAALPKHTEILIVPARSPYYTNGPMN